MPAPVVGAFTVACPSCRAVAGRPCVDGRGYLYRGGAHVMRHQDWLAAEAVAMERAREKAAEAAAWRAKQEAAAAQT